MTKMHEYSGDVTVTLKKRLARVACNEDDFVQTIRRDMDDYDGLNDFLPENIADIKVDDVRKVK